MKEAGAFNSSQYAGLNEEIDHAVCTNGTATYIPDNPMYAFRCKNMDLYDFKSHVDLGSVEGFGAGSWGWTDSSGREFAAIAQIDGTAFLEVTKRGKLVYLGRLPQFTTANPSPWREIKGYKSYIVIGSEAQHHGIQLFDLRRLAAIDPANPVVFDNEKDLDGHWSEGLPTGQSHNVVTNEEMNYGVATGFQPRDGPLRAGLVFFDLTDPSKPKRP